MKTPLYISMQKGNKDIVELLLEKKVDVNLKSNISFSYNEIECNNIISPLYIAIVNDQIEIVQLLLSHKKINANSKDEISDIGLLKKTYALHKAVEKGNLNMIQILLINNEINKQFNSYEIVTISSTNIF